MTNLFGEFFGTMVLIIFGGGVVANVLLKDSKGNGGGWIVITAGWAFAVSLGVFAAQATGAPQADLNPAVTFAKLLAGGVYATDQALFTMAAEMAGAFVGAVIVWLAYLPHWEITDDPGLKLAVFSTGPAVRNTMANFLCEVIATAMLMLGIWVIFSKATGSIPPGVGPYLVGILIWALGLSLGGPTGYALNPARDLGPRIAHAVLPIAGKGSSDWGYAWIPVVAPMVGGGIAYVIAKASGII
ncbi:putative glycerol uptake facilitator protein [Propionispora sp. 2/2-37]|uniref:MIP/aquaporin family protein n=1 Tax=Propionispora sp. 2/2-37 TaxID=1677858 RepID=UPI0006BB97D9|nr:MIP/aquaporin family protein [Propionispora sp. 2/2-37]CUH94354.1 putative glycerol uptake facilitator protein [Propionispora sp. 2/2-37]